MTVALIVKNEEHHLDRCLESVRGAVDEIVIVDTGSKDRTKEIARRYTHRIFDFEWTQNFAAARQYSFEQATGDWIFWLDADDVVRNAAAIRYLTKNASPEINVIHWPYVCAWDHQGNVVEQNWRERCIRNNGKAQWLGRIHEILLMDGGHQYSSEVVVEHHTQWSVSKLKRNIEIMEDQRQEEGDSPRLLFHLGRDYASIGDTERALEAFTRYTQLAPADDVTSQAQLKIAELLRIRGRYREALDADFTALKIQPLWPDAYFGLARTYFALRDWPKVVHWTDLGRTMRPPDTVSNLNPMDYRYNWIIYYVYALMFTGKMPEALAWTRTALVICPGARWHVQSERFLSLVLRALTQ